jgi:2,4-dienoyl-CoA reductase-like NADH-dependent reductase (Old Yellow Enzyme family)
MSRLFEPLVFARGPAMKNRFMLAPLTNQQSHADGTLSDEEFRWLTMRAEGGFGLTMTCASHVQAQGQGFPGQLGIFSDAHLPGLTRLASTIRAAGSIAVTQLHHAGMRSPAALIGHPPVAPSDDAETGARALTTGEVETLAEDFIRAAERAEKAGFDGVELHGAHGYILCQFISPESNRRDDRYGGSLENRTRIVRDIIAGIRKRCREDFSLGIRLSAERFGVRLPEMRDFAAELMASGDLDYIDMSLWDVFKEPADAQYKGRRLMSWFADIPRHETRLGVAGKIVAGRDAARVVEEGADFAIVGRSAILHHDFPKRVAADPDFKPVGLPVSRAWLNAEGLSEAFIGYMGNWKGFVAETEPVS